MAAIRSSALLMIALLPVSAGGCSDTCGNEVISRIAAPDGERSVVLFHRDCGATTASSTQISILSGQETPNGSGNAFRADDDHGRANAGAWGSVWTDARWLSSDELLVRYAKGARIFEQENSVSGVSIRYQPIAQ